MRNESNVLCLEGESCHRTPHAHPVEFESAASGISIAQLMHGWWLLDLLGRGILTITFRKLVAGVQPAYE